MKLRALMLAALLMGLLPSVAWADEGHGRWAGQWVSDRVASRFFGVRLASGLAAGGTNDPTVTVVPPGSSTSQAAVVCSARPSAWAAPLRGSNWISTQGDCTQNFATGNYSYSATFTLPANPGPYQISGWVLADDSVTVQLNGHSLFSGGGFTQASPFSSNDQSAFNTGSTANTLTFVVNNTGGPTGLDFAVGVSSGASGALPAVARNHGQCVSQAVHEAHSEWRGRGHGFWVSQAAHSCSNAGDDDNDGD